MKRLFVLVTVVFSLIACQAQSVLGIKFGSSYSDVKEQLENRFGLYKTYDDGGSLCMYNIYMGDIEFNSAKFYFQYSGNKSWFNAAEFQKHYPASEVSAAKNTRDYLFTLIKDKYEDEYLEEFTNEQGFKCYKFGSNPYDESNVLGIIQLKRGKGKDGISRLYLFLNYLPISYVSKSSDF